MSKSNTRRQENDNSDGLVHFSIIASLKETPTITGSAHAAYAGGFALGTEKVGFLIHMLADLQVFLPLCFFNFFGTIYTKLKSLPYCAAKLHTNCQ